MQKHYILKKNKTGQSTIVRGPTGLESPIENGAIGHYKTLFSQILIFGIIYDIINQGKRI